VNGATVPPGNSEAPPSQLVRDALDRILRSGALNRAPKLILFLRYICEMQLAGRTDAIKEYSIAVEALGRCGDFDQKKDSIVRVEAYRLRKRLAEYYEAAGAEDPMEILLPPGSYVPVFRRRNGAAKPSSAVPTAAELPSVIPAAGPVSHRGPRLWTLALLTVLSIAAAGIYQWQTGSTRSAAAGATARVTSAPLAASRGQMMRIAAGSDRDGIAEGTGTPWQGDQFFVGGDVVTATPRNIERTADDPLYLTRREGDFEYRIPVTPGSWEVRLHFAETVFGEENVAGGGESSRVFQVQVNDGDVWTADIISEAAGANTATIRVFSEVHPTSDGTIHIAFRPSRKEAAFVNAIEVLPAAERGTVPVRLVARAAPIVLPSGPEWSGDRYSLGGTTVQRHESVDGTEPSALYEAERYGNFSYAVPVAPGLRYTLTLRFAETWFGPGRPGGGGEGSRVFDIYCNGRALLRNFDVFHEAGGSMRQLKKVFRNLEPNAQGKLNIQFVPIRNYAMINAIEVVADR
jgi:hypothetical protein